MLLYLHARIDMADYSIDITVGIPRDTDSEKKNKVF